MTHRKVGFTVLELLIVITIIAILAGLLFPVFAHSREKARQVVCASNLRQCAVAALLYSQDWDEWWCRPFFYKHVTVPLDCRQTVFWDDILFEAGLLKDMRLALCPARSFERCSYDSTKWFNGIKPYSYTINTMEMWEGIHPEARGWQPGNHHGVHDPFGTPNGDPGRPISSLLFETPGSTIWLMDSDSQLNLWLESLLEYNGNSSRNFRRHLDGFTALYLDGHTKWHHFGSTRPRDYTVQDD